MMLMRNSKVSGAVIAALSLTGLLALSACEERPYPTAARSYEAPRPPPPPAPLAGAPAYTPPPPPAQAYAPPPPVQTYAPPPPARYDNTVIVGMAPIPNPGEPGSDGYYQGYRPHGHGYAPAPAYADGYAPPPRHKTYHTPAPPKVYKPAPAPVYAAKPPVKDYKPAPVPKPSAPTYAAKPVPAPKPPAPTYAAKPVTPPPPPKKTDSYAQKGAVAGAAVGAAAGVVAKDAKPGAKAVVDTAKATYDAKKAPPAAPVTAAKIAKDAGAVAAAAGAAAGVAAKDVGHTAMAATDKAKDAAASTKAAVATAPAAKPAAPASPAGGNSADRSTRLAALQSALTDAVSKGAVLTTPARFTANTPADVTLTVPAGFYDSLHKEAEKNGLTDAAASVNMTAVLSGDGFSVTPDETQSVPLTVGQPTEFRWTVTAQPGAKGPLHADVGADLLGGGSDTLALGSVQKAGGFGPKLNSQIVGGILLVLIAALVVAWLARGRGPSRPASARRASRAARGARPLDMGETPSH